MRRAGFLIAVLVVFAAMTITVAVRSFTGGAEDPGEWQRQATPVLAYEVPAVEFADVVEALGTARARETVTITARVSDTLSRINFDSGQRVEAGDILVELTDTEEAAGLAEARATLREAEREMSRTDDLIARGVAPQQRQDEARAAVDRARARVRSIEAQLADRIVRAPFTGVVGLREVSAGGLVRPGDPIASLDDTSIIKLDFTVPERFLAAVDPGMPVEARTSAYPDEIFVGEVAQIDSRVDPVTRAVTIRAEIENADGRIRPGQLMTVEIRRDMRMSPAVPGASITRYLDQSFVFVVDESGEGASVHQRAVSLGLRSGQLVEVTDGLEVGEVIVGEGVHRVRDGEAVTVAERQTTSARSGRTGGAATSASSQP